MTAGWLWLITIIFVAVALAVVLATTNRGADFRLVRWPLALAVLLFAVVAMTTAPWPGGLGIQACSDLINPALANNPDVVPTVHTCGPVEAAGAAALFTIALVLFLISPELTEFGVPGLLTLKRQLAEETERVERLETRLTSISAAAAMSRVDNQITVTTEAARQGRLSELWPALSKAADLSIEAVLKAGAIEVSTSSRFAFYRHIGSGHLRQWDRTEPHITDFQSGHGATGQAWRDNETKVVTGAAVHNDEYGLTTQQQQHFADLTIVAATPVLDVGGRHPVGVLTATSSDAIDDVDLGRVKAEFKDVVESTSRTLSVVLAAYDLYPEEAR